jgi:hypothetical protein
VTVEWDLEYLDFFVGCNDPRVFGAVSGSVTFYFDPDDVSLSKLVCIDGIPVGDDTPYKVADGVWDVPSGASYPLRISGEINPSPDCFGMQVLLTSEFGTGLQWTPGAFGGEYQELTEDLSANPPCTATEVSVRGTITMTDTFPSTAEACGCP